MFLFYPKFLVHRIFLSVCVIGQDCVVRVQVLVAFLHQNRVREVCDVCVCVLLCLFCPPTTVRGLHAGFCPAVVHAGRKACALTLQQMSDKC